MSNTAEKPHIITAGDLRRMGAEIPEDIPDCAWIPAYALQVIVHDVSLSEVELGKVTATFDLKINAPWQWFQVDVTIPKQETDGDGES